MARKFDWTQALLGGALRGVTKHFEERKTTEAENKKQQRMLEGIESRAKKTAKEPKVPKQLTSKDIIGLIDYKIYQGKKLTPQEVHLKDAASRATDELGVMSAAQQGIPYVGGGTLYNRQFFEQPGVQGALDVPVEKSTKTKTKWDKFKDTLGIYGGK